MGIKLFAFAAAFSATLWYFGYGPEDLRRAAHDMSSANASAISPGGEPTSDWGDSY